MVTRHIMVSHPLVLRGEEGRRGGVFVVENVGVLDLELTRLLNHLD